MNRILIKYVVNKLALNNFFIYFVCIEKNLMILTIDKLNLALNIDYKLKKRWNLTKKNNIELWLVECILNKILKTDIRKDIIHLLCEHL